MAKKIVSGIGARNTTPMDFLPDISDLDYSSIYDNRLKFVQSGTRYGSDFNYYDVPTTKYFKILFHFYNGDVDGNENGIGGTGLLHPTWINDGDIYANNSAYSYLIINDEQERADLLKDFVTLLSNINCESPWYFKEITGLDTVLERKIDNIKFEEQRQKISIKCLQDSFDDRIGTLMDLYRAIVWSWQMKREVVPSNLRKFDMSIYIFSDAVAPFHRKRYDIAKHSYNNTTGKIEMSNIEYANFKGNDTSYQTSYKCIEFHNCEFDYNSAKTPLGTLDNTQGLAPEYTIDIYFDDCYETRYNEFLMKEIGDIIKWDIDVNSSRMIHDKSSINKNALEEKISYEENLHMFDKNTIPDKKLKGYPEDLKFGGGFITNTVNQLLSTGINAAESYVKGKLLGNLFTYSLTKIGSQISSLMNGNVLGSYNAIKDYVTEEQQRKGTGIHQVENINGKNIFNNESTYQVETPSGSIFDDPGISNDVMSEGNIFDEAPIPQINTYLGNIFTAKTLANNL